MNEILQLILFVYALGLAFFAGVGIGDNTKWRVAELPLLLLWPVSIPLIRAAHYWRFGLLKRRFVYLDTKWYQRGELVSRHNGLTYKECHWYSS